MDIVTKMRWNCLKETLSLFARENELGDPLDVALKLIFQNCWWPESHEIAYWKILAGDGNEQQDGLSAIRGLLLKN